MANTDGRYNQSVEQVAEAFDESSNLTLLWVFLFGPIYFLFNGFFGYFFLFLVVMIAGNAFLGAAAASMDSGSGGMMMLIAVAGWIGIVWWQYRAAKGAWRKRALDKAFKMNLVQQHQANLMRQ